MRNEDRTDGKTREQLTEELASLRQQVAELEVSAAEHRQTEQELCQRNWELALLSRVGQEFTATLDLQQVTEQLLPAVTEIIGAEGASVWLWDEMAEGCLVCRTAYHRGQGCSPVDLRLRLRGDGLAGLQVPLVEQPGLAAEQGDEVAGQRAVAQPGAEDLQSFLYGRAAVGVTEEYVPEDVAAATRKTIEEDGSAI